MPADDAARAIQPCCGSREWAARLAARRPISSEAALFAAADEVWRALNRHDWIEAFNSHPRIGESRAALKSHPHSAAWSSQEQSGAANNANEVKLALAQGNLEYERRFGRIFIVCATGKDAAEMLEILRRRLQNDPETELLEAAEQQRQITRIRLKKWMAE